MKIQDTFKEIVKTSIAPLFKDEGFRKSGNNFYKQVNDDIWWCANLQQSAKTNTATEMEFTIDAGIYVPIVDQILFNFGHKFPKLSECIIDRRISKLRAVNGDYWYRLNHKYIDLDLFRETVEGHIHDFIFPFLKTFKSINEVIHELETQTTYVNPYYLPILYTHYKDRELAERILLNKLKDNPEDGNPSALRIAKQLGFDFEGRDI